MSEGANYYPILLEIHGDVSDGFLIVNYRNPTFEDVERLCSEYGFDVETTKEYIQKAIDQGRAGIAFEAEAYRKHLKEIGK